MSADDRPETGNTDFAIRRGKLQIRLAWAAGVLVVALQLLTNAGIWLNHQLVTRQEFNDVAKVLGDHESRLRLLEHKP